MRTLKLVLVCIILIFTFQMCNNDNNEITSPQVKKIQLGSDDPIPCCNSGYPPDCDPSFTMGLFTTEGEIGISCECCQDIYHYYNDPPNLRSIEVPPNIVNLAGCEETKW